MKAEDYRKAANYWANKDRVEMPHNELIKFTEEYVGANSVCALATGTGDYVRCTPLEYSYHDGQFWIFTEGGEKFVGLEKNKNVSLAIFDKNLGFANLKSVQIMGVADVVEPMSDEYVSHAEYKKIPMETLAKLKSEGHPMNLLKISPTRMDILCSDFKKQGYDVRQVMLCSDV